MLPKETVLVWRVTTPHAGGLDSTLFGCQREWPCCPSCALWVTSWPFILLSFLTGFKESLLGVQMMVCMANGSGDLPTPLQPWKSILLERWWGKHAWKSFFVFYGTCYSQGGGVGPAMDVDKEPFGYVHITSHVAQILGLIRFVYSAGSCLRVCPLKHRYVFAHAIWVKTRHIYATAHLFQTMDAIWAKKYIWWFCSGGWQGVSWLYLLGCKKREKALPDALF